MAFLTVQEIQSVSYCLSDEDFTKIKDYAKKHNCNLDVAGLVLYKIGEIVPKEEDEANREFIAEEFDCIEEV